MAEEVARLLSISALAAAGLVGARVAWACQKAKRKGLPGSDAVVWAGLAMVFLTMALTKIARDMGWLGGWGVWLRTLAKQHNLYADRRPLQILATVAVAVIVILLLLYGLVWLWDAIKRYRLAVGFAAMAAGFAFIRFISLHEVDAWNIAFPWAKTVVEIIAATGALAIALARLRQLRE